MVYDGRFLYVVSEDKSTGVSRYHRYDTLLAFTETGAWQSHSLANSNPQWARALEYDGRYLYLFGSLSIEVTDTGGAPPQASLRSLAVGSDLFINPSGFVGIGTRAPAVALDIQGDLTATGAAMAPMGLFDLAFLTTSVTAPAGYIDVAQGTDLSYDTMQVGDLTIASGGTAQIDATATFSNTAKFTGSVEVDAPAQFKQSLTFLPATRFAVHQLLNWANTALPRTATLNSKGGKLLFFVSATGSGSPFIVSVVINTGTVGSVSCQGTHCTAANSPIVITSLTTGSYAFQIEIATGSTMDSTDFTSVTVVELPV